MRGVSFPLLPYIYDLFPFGGGARDTRYCERQRGERESEPIGVIYTNGHIAHVCFFVHACVRVCVRVCVCACFTTCANAHTPLCSRGGEEGHNSLSLSLPLREHSPSPMSGHSATGPPGHAGDLSPGEGTAVPPHVRGDRAVNFPRDARDLFAA